MSDLVKAHALLSSLKANLPDNFEVGREWVDDYHSILDSIEKETGESRREFRVSDQDVYKPIISRNTLTGETKRSTKARVQRSRLLTKVDAVLGYFHFQTAPPDKQPIGFKKPRV